MSKDKKHPIVERIEMQFKQVDELKEVLLDENLSEQEKLDKINEFENNIGFVQKLMQQIEEERKKPSFVHKKTDG